MSNKQFPLFLIALVFTCFSAYAKPAKSNGQAGRTGDGKPDTYEKLYDQTVSGRSVDEYFAAINGGWGRNLSTLRKELHPERSYLVLHSQEPKDVMDLRSAEKFKQGMMSKGILNMTNSTLGIGHVFLSWRCQVDGQMLEGTVGMTGELSEQFKQMIANGWGLSTFLAKFEDGHLQTPALLDFEFEHEDPLHTLAIEVEPAVCGNALRFVKEFLSHEDEPHTTFGLQMDPAKFEGGGCGSFGVTVMDRSGIFEGQKIIPNFWRTIYGKKSLFGYGNELPEDATAPEFGKEGQKKISMLQLFMLKSWDPSRREDGQKIKFMDPELLLLFFKTVYRSFLDDIYRANGSLGAEFKNSQLYKLRVTIQNTFTGPLTAAGDSWGVLQTGEQRIDANFDPQAATTVAQTKAWANRLKSRGYRARPIRLGDGKHSNIGVVLSR